MSMHDIEGFAQDAVLFVGKAAMPAEQKIDLIHNVYRFQDDWDTGFTKLRVYDVLVETGYPVKALRRKRCWTMWLRQLPAAAAILP